MKTVIFLLIVASLAAIHAKPGVEIAASVDASTPHDEDTINCFIVHFKKKGLFTAEYNPKPSSNVLVNCEGLIAALREKSLDTYTKIFSRNKNTAETAQCIVDHFKQTDGSERILLNLIYDDARIKGSLDKNTFCKLSVESKLKVESDLIASFKACNPGNEFGNLFTFLSECDDPKE